MSNSMDVPGHGDLYTLILGLTGECRNATLSPRLPYLRCRIVLEYSETMRLELLRVHFQATRRASMPTSVPAEVPEIPLGS